MIDTDIQAANKCRVSLAQDLDRHVLLHNHVVLTYAVAQAYLHVIIEPPWREQPVANLRTITTI